MPPLGISPKLPITLSKKKENERNIVEYQEIQ